MVSRAAASLRRHGNVLALVVIVLGLGGANLLWTAHVVNANQSAQRNAGSVVERKLCQDIGTMAALQPPGGPAYANPSRAYEQAEHQAWTGLFQAIGCDPGRH